MAPHHTLALKAIDKGAEAIPDKAFEKIPLAGPRYFRPKDGGGSKSNRNGDDNQDSQRQDWSSDSEQDQREVRRRRRRQRREQERRDRGYESDRGTQSNMNYFPPPPTVPMYEQPNDRTDSPSSYQPYNPANYINRQQQPSPLSTYASDDSHRNSSIADRYRPAGYPAPDESYQRGPSPQKQLGYRTYEPPDSTALTVRPPQEVYEPYPPMPYPDSEPKHHHDRERRGSSKLKDELKQHKDVGVSALGALAGGLLGKELSRGSGKTGLLIGAAIGGIGANVVEKRFEKGKQEKERPRRHRKDDYDYGYDSY